MSDLPGVVVQHELIVAEWSYSLALECSGCGWSHKFNAVSVRVTEITVAAEYHDDYVRTEMGN